MQDIVTSAIVLKRLNYSEADRIITVLSKDGRKLKLIAKGVRKSTSKLAGGIELFSVSDIRYIKGKNDIDTLVSTRILHNYRQISKNLETTRAGYEMIATTDAITEHSIEPKYYFLLKESLELLDKGIKSQIVLAMFYIHILNISGHTLNLTQDVAGNVFDEKNNYHYNFEMGGFEQLPHGHSSTVIKILKLFTTKQPELLMKISGMDEELPGVLSTLKLITEYYLHFRYKR